MTSGRLLSTLALAAALAPLPATPQTPTYRTLYSFRGTARDGGSPNAPLMLGANGLLYGTTSGPPANNGTVFSVNRNNGQETVLYRFKGNADGSNPTAGLYQDAKGLLYGTTYGGGLFGRGTVFRLNPITHRKTTLHDFQGEPDGEFPDSALIPAIPGGTLIYGTTYAGGILSGAGTIYSIDTTTGAFTSLHTFNGTDGGGLNATLTQGPPGLLYGASPEGGSHGQGTIFSFNAVKNGFKLLYTFTGQADGGNPEGTLAYDPATKSLYGTSVELNSYGAIFSFNTHTGAVSTLYNFTGGADGYFPFSGITLAKGLLFGTTDNGVGFGGSIFSFSPATFTLTTLYRFSGVSGSSHLLNVGGTLFGTTVNAGPADAGTVFKEIP